MSMDRSGEPFVCETLPSPSAVRAQFPCSGDQERQVQQWRSQVASIVNGTDPRQLLVVGPCSIHNVDAFREYAQRLRALADQVSDRFFITVRAYIEKPRTGAGWTGFLYDPNLDGSYRLREGLLRSRMLLLELLDIGLPAATEFLDPCLPAYLSDLITWGSIGSRTSESQPHRQMVSALSIPTGFKNSTDGTTTAAIYGMKVASRSNTFIGIGDDGQVGVVRSDGNPHCHIVLRGGSQHPNYDRASIDKVIRELRANNLAERLIIDCSHDNSRRDPLQQIAVFQDVIQQTIEGNTAIRGLILESYLRTGQQVLPDESSRLSPDLSITDPCLGWDETERLVQWAYKTLQHAQPNLQPN